MSIFDNDTELLDALMLLGPTEVYVAMMAGVTKERGIISAYRGDEHKAFIWADLAEALRDRDNDVSRNRVAKFVTALVQDLGPPGAPDASDD